MSITYIPDFYKKPEPLATTHASAWGEIPSMLASIIAKFNIQTSVALEFGVEFGYSTTALSYFFNEVIGVDTFEGDFSQNMLGAYTVSPRCHFERTSSELSSWKNIFLQKLDYREFIALEKNNKMYDLIHIDIVHDYTNTYNCGEWAVQHSNVVIFHDTLSFPKVHQACEDLAAKYNLEFYNYPMYYGLGILVKK